MSQLRDLPSEILAIILGQLSMEAGNLRLTSHKLKSLVDNNPQLWSPYLDSETIQDLKKNQKSYFDFVRQHYFELEAGITKLQLALSQDDCNAIDRADANVKLLLADVTKVRLLSYHNHFRDFLFSEKEYFVTLAQKHEFMALALLEKPVDLLKIVEKKFSVHTPRPMTRAQMVMRPISADNNALRIVATFAREHASSTLLLLKDPTISEFLIQPKCLTTLLDLATKQKEAFICAITESTTVSTKLKYLRTMLKFHGLSIQNAVEDTFLAFSQSKECVEHLKFALSDSAAVTIFFRQLERGLELPNIQTDATIEGNLTKFVTALNDRRAAARIEGP